MCTSWNSRQGSNLLQFRARRCVQRRRHYRNPRLRAQKHHHGRGFFFTSSAAPTSAATNLCICLQSRVKDTSRSSDDLEGKIGKLWLNRIGVVAILIGVAYFIKYAFDSQLIGAAGRIALGLLSGIAVIVLSEIVRRQGQVAFSYSLKAVGIGVLYLSLWGAFQVYHLIPAEVAFGAMLLVTVFTVILALTQDAEILAAFAIIGGFSTPVLLSTGTNAEVFLFSYVGLLDLGMLALVFLKPWRRLLWGSFVGTLILYVGWYGRYYQHAAQSVTVGFLLFFVAIFATVPLVTPLSRSRWHSGFSITLTVLPLLNAASAFWHFLKSMTRNLRRSPGGR